tara:strand:+ start:191 stop:844 length:654 start_codon:yes stop_codon:yes gene_type:complete
MINMTFNSIQNKGFLWNLMYENGIFNNLQPELLENIKNTFEKIILEVDNIDTITNIQDKNKQTLILMTESIINITGNNFKQQPVTNEERIHERKETLDTNYKKHMDDFNNTINVGKPDNIDFTDSNDEPLENNIDSIIENTLNQRSTDLKQAYDNLQNKEIAKTSTNTVLNNKINIIENKLDKLLEIIEPIINKDLLSKINELHNKICESNYESVPS